MKKHKILMGEFRELIFKNKEASINIYVRVGKLENLERASLNWSRFILSHPYRIMPITSNRKRGVIEPNLYSMSFFNNEGYYTAWSSQLWYTEVFVLGPVGFSNPGLDIRREVTEHYRSMWESR